MKNLKHVIFVVILMTFGFGCQEVDSADYLSVEQLELPCKANNHCIKKVAKRLGIKKKMHTDPELITEILRDDMLLSDLPSVTELLSESLHKPVSLTKILKQIKRAIHEKHPAVNEFLCAALEADLIPKVKKHDEAAVTISRVIHHTYILNELTLEMARNYGFHIELRNHLLAKREEFGIRSDLVGALEDLKEIYGGEMFGPTKVVSMDLTNDLLIGVRASGTVTPEAFATFAGAVKLNILEASVTENLFGYNDNAMVGAVLAAIPPKSITLEEGTLNSQWDYSQNWNSLYETWNLAFVTGNATYHQVYYPKLLIPAVIDADNLSYISNRAMSLWLSLYFRQFAALSGRADLRVPNQEDLTVLWGEINYPYAEALAIEETGYPIEAFAPSLNLTLAQIMEYMKQSFAAVELTPEEQERLEALYEAP